jgi:hypothetical protein
MRWRGNWRNPPCSPTVESCCRARQSGHRAHAQCVALDVADHGAVIAFCNQQQVAWW